MLRMGALLSALPVRMVWASGRSREDFLHHGGFQPAPQALIAVCRQHAGEAMPHQRRAFRVPEDFGVADHRAGGALSDEERPAHDAARGRSLVYPANWSGGHETHFQDPGRRAVRCYRRRW